MKVADFAYQYSSASRFGAIANEKALLFSHCSEVEADDAIDCFYYGRFTNSFLASQCMVTLAKTVRSHFAIAQGLHMRLRDPIISVGNSQLRFEGFSSCNGVYARVDMDDAALDGEFLNEGCTNIDFNNPTIRAFNEVGRGEKLILGIGEKQTNFITETENIIEKKVNLPTRWIKGLGNVQTYLSEMECAFKLTKIEAIQFFRSVPKTPVKNDYFIVKEQSKCYLSTTAKPKALRIAGVHRLTLLNGLLTLIDSVSFYANESEQSLAITMHFNNMRMLFVFSPGVYRGFSGEGKTLENQTLILPDDYILGVNQLCKTNGVFDTNTIAIESDVDFRLMDGLTATLSSIGLLGYDLEEQQHFYRRLPFKLNRLKGLNPRFANAQKLVAKNFIEITSAKSGVIVAQVKGTDGVTHKVILDSNQNRCTCTWYTKHQDKRGFCKHILGVKMKLEETDS